jgi:hypothetical protein
LVTSVVTNKAIHQQYGLVLAVGPMIVKGVPTWPSKIAAALDEDTAWFYRVAGATLAAETGSLPEDWDRLVAQITADRSFSSRVEEAERLREEFDQKLDEFASQSEQEIKSIGNLPEELRDDAIQFLAPPRTLTLERASIKLAGEPWDEVGTMRVMMAQVTAWWTFRLTPTDEALPFLSTPPQP